MQSNPQLELARQFVEFTNQNIFLTGKAGTGKTTFLRQLKKELPKRMIIVAPTGVAAINAGGVTIHSFFQLAFGPIVSQQYFPNNTPLDPENIKRFSREKIKVIKGLDLLVIDEISMVRADLLDGIDEVLRRFKHKHLPFGGVQVLMIGDLQQLAPVVTDSDWSILRPYYDNLYFFNSKALKESSHISIELKHIYRQKDNTFISILNEIRENRLSEESLNELNNRYKANFTPKPEEGYIQLSTHNKKAQNINQTELQKISLDEQQYKAKIQGEFPEYAFPTDETLILKKGAQVMFVKNDTSPEKRYYNGKIGIIKHIEAEEIVISCDGDKEDISVQIEEWQNIKYSVNEETKEIKEEVVGSFSQYPLKLAWAITIHKSQGLTFEKAIIDAEASFAHGQVYVALSRCKSLEGLVLSSRIEKRSIIADQRVLNFTQHVENNIPSSDNLEVAKKLYMLSLVEEAINYQPIATQMYYGLKQLSENSGSYVGDLQQILRDIVAGFKPEVLEVSAKFVQQLKYLLSQDDMKAFYERIGKASAYYLQKSKQYLTEQLQGASFDSDNKKLKKAINEILERIANMQKVKEVCLNELASNFELKDYLDTRAKALIESESKPKGSTAKSSKVKLEGEYGDIYEHLRAWRNAQSKEQQVPAYMILSQKALIEISKKKPRNEKALLDIKGVGKKTFEKYGAEIFEILAMHVSNHPEEKSEQSSLGF